MGTAIDRSEKQRRERECLWSSIVEEEAGRRVSRSASMSPWTSIDDRPLRLRPGAPACVPTIRDGGAELPLAA
jgi:hypothetical protein